jgi:single-strand DNA-binding protein
VRRLVVAGNRFEASMAGRVATAPSMGESRDGQPWAKFRMAVDDRVRNPGTGEWETAQTIFHDVVVFGKLAERAIDRLQTGDAVLVQGEFRFQTYQDVGGKMRTATSFVASRVGPDLLLADVIVPRDRVKGRAAERAHTVVQEPSQTPESPTPGAEPARPPAHRDGRAAAGTADVSERML